MVIANIVIAILIASTTWLWIEYKGLKNAKNPEIVKEIAKKVELTDEEKEKQTKIKKSFDNLMGYGYEEALKSKGE